MRGWRYICWEDIPTRDFFETMTISLLREGISNSDRMRDTIRRRQKLILSKATGVWNSSPSDKFINEHAWALERLVAQGAIEKVAPKEYRLL